MNFLGLALDHHPRLDARAAGRHEFAVDLHQANQAGVQRPAFLQVTKRRNVEADGAGRGEDGLAGRHFDLRIIDAM